MAAIRSIGSWDARWWTATSTPPSASMSYTSESPLWVARCGVGIAPGAASSLSQRASSFVAVTDPPSGSKRQVAVRCRPPAAKVRVTCQTPSSSREESHSTSSRSTPRSRSRSDTRSARVTGPAPRLPTAHFWATWATCSRSASTGPSKRRTFSTVQPARSATSSVGQAPTDQRLHLARSQPTVDLDLQLAEPGPVTTGRRSQGLVEAESVAAAIGVREQEVLAVLVDADEAKVLHVGLPELLVVGTTVPSRGAG